MTFPYAILGFTCACLLTLAVLHLVFAKCSKERDWAFAMDCAATVTIGIAWIVGLVYFAKLMDSL